MESQRKPADTTIDLIPSTGHIVVETPIISKRTPSGLIKTDAQIAKEANDLPKFVKVVGIGADVFDINNGDYVALDQASGPKFKDGERAYIVIHENSVVAIATGKFKADAEAAYTAYLENNRSGNQSKASSIILGAQN